MMNTGGFEGLQNLGGDDNQDVMNIFILDYLQKMSLDDTAKSFFLETMNEFYEPPIDSPKSFLLNWFESIWSGICTYRMKTGTEVKVEGNSTPQTTRVDENARREPNHRNLSLLRNILFPSSFTMDREKSIANFNPLMAQARLYPMPPMNYPLTPSEALFSQIPGATALGGNGAPTALKPEFMQPQPQAGMLDDSNQIVYQAQDREGMASILSRQIVKNGKRCFERINSGPTVQGGPPVSPEVVDPAEADRRRMMSSDGKKVPGNQGKSRASQYRGVSRNGNQWQAIIMVHNKKRYIGSYSVETEAAKAYDRAALQFHGEKAKTNFTYSVEEIAAIRREDPIIPEI
eukprot:TRINITY_DN4059_c0_g1_i9.p1 TRINITY_DN4059_c0_g1~~TRINITY_DN4059_c0_g1_i9.p1  ORF type:complete len:346 (+),score=62.52 TRINITY_DN4059_c0_g1_i9:179-1216(+)